MKCPRCHEPLHVSDVDGIEIDVCLTCKGVWLDNDELRQTKDLSEPDANWLDFDIWKHEDRFKINDSASRANCPRCGRAMCALCYSDTEVEIDVCPACRGSWLDDAELSHIVHALNNEINSKSFGQYIPAAIEEAIEILTGPETLASEWSDFKEVLRLMNVRLFVQHPVLYEAMESVQRSMPIR